MILPGVILTPALAAWLRAAHDDGQAELDVIPAAVVRARNDGSWWTNVIPDDESDCWSASIDDAWSGARDNGFIVQWEGHTNVEIVDALTISRANGTELSHTEQTEVRAMLAAHAAEPFRQGPIPGRVRTWCEDATCGECPACLAEAASET